MAQTPKLPDFDKQKFAEQPLFAAFWEMIQPHLKLNARVQDRGITVSENMSGAWLNISITSAQTYPLTQSVELGANQRPYGLLLAGVFNPAAAAVAFLTGPVTVDWAPSDAGGITIFGIPGLPAGKACTVRVLVLAQ